MIFNVREQPEYLYNIKVVHKMKYLGIEIDITSRHKESKLYKIPNNNKYNILENFLEKYSSTITSVWYKYNK